MKYHIVSWDSPAGSLKYYFQKNNITDIILNHFDDLSVWPLHINFDERSNWIKKRLFPWDNANDNEEIIRHIKETHQVFVDYVGNLRDEDEIYIWYGKNIIENLMLYKSCSDIKKGKIYVIYVSKHENKHWSIPRAVWECSPEDLWKLISTWRKLWQKEIAELSDYYKNIVNKKSCLRILNDWKVQHVEETYYDEELLRNTPIDTFISTPRVVWNVMWHSEQWIWDSYLQYRLKYLIDNNKITTQGKLDSMRTFKIKQ